jgi:hypothetical protein
VDFEELQSILDDVRDKQEGLRFQPLDLNSIRVVCYSDAGFVSLADDLKSHLGYVIAIVDGHDRANVVAFATRKCRRVTRSVLASEQHALVDGYDAAAAIATQLSEILGIVVPEWHAIESRTLFSIVPRMGNVTERGLSVDAAEVREQHLQKKLKLFWIPSEENCGDPFTKKKGSYAALEGLLAGKLSEAQTYGLNIWRK